MKIVYSLLLFSLIFLSLLQAQNNNVILPVTPKEMTFSYGNATKNLVEPGNTTLVFKIPDFTVSETSEVSFMVNEEEKTFRKSEPGVIAKMPFYYFEQNGVTLDTFLILDNEKAIPGVYTMNITEKSILKQSTVHLRSKPVLPEVHKPKRVLEGDSLKLKCVAKAFPKVTSFVWEFSFMDSEGKDDEEAQKNALTNFTSIQLNNNKVLLDNGAFLTIKTLTKDDNGLYRCKASNDDGSDSIIYYVNIKNRWAALWPFIGIVIEVAVLVSAILLYERHAMKNKGLPDAPNRVNQSQTNVGPHIVNANQEAIQDANKDSLRERNIKT